MEDKVIEGNRLIAEFDGAKIKPLNYMRSEFIVAEYPSVFNGLYCHQISDLKYHSSWDWLMPVAEKIKSLGFHVEIVFTRDYNSTRIYRGKDDKIKNCCFVDKKTFEAIVQFVQWYNQSSNLKQ